MWAVVTSELDVNAFNFGGLPEPEEQTIAEVFPLPVKGSNK